MNVGIVLQQARTERNLSLKMVTERTKIQAWVLEALESDRLQEMMSPIYVKGFLTNYARFLHLDPTPLMAQFSAPQTPAVPELQLPPAPPAKTEKPQVPIHIPWPLLRQIGSGVAIATALVGLIVINPLKHLPHVSLPHLALPKIAKRAPSANAAKKKPEAMAQKPAVPHQPQAPSVTPSPAALPVGPTRLATPAALTMASVAPVSDPLKPEPPPTLVLLATQPLELLVNAKRATWVTVRADGRLIAEQRLVRGAQEHWTAKKQFELVIAKPTEVELTLNGQPISPFAVAHHGRMLITHRGITKLPGEE